MSDKKRKREDVGPGGGLDKQWAALDEHPLQVLLGASEAEEQRFFTEAWEARPRVFCHTACQPLLCADLFSWARLEAEVTERERDEREVLEFGADVVAMRVQDGQREALIHEGTMRQVLDADTLATVRDAGGTLQVHQPQRWAPDLARIVFALERRLGCLVGVNAYLTPAGAQGLAAHYDDVEIFAVQTEGSKRWRAFEPLPGRDLPVAPSRDLDEAALGPPVLNAKLQVGDVLYLPRGTPHVAVAGEDGPSTHITLSTYQRWSYGDLIQHLTAKAMHVCKPAAADRLRSLRQGVPIACLAHIGAQLDALPVPVMDGRQHLMRARTGLVAALRALADAAEGDDDLVGAAVDDLAADFMRSRLPPPPHLLAEPGPAPGYGDMVAARGPNGVFRLVACAPTGDEPEGFPVDGGFVKVLSSLGNNATMHMMGAPPVCQHAHTDDSTGGIGEEDGAAPRPPGRGTAANGGVGTERGDKDEDEDEENEDEDESDNDEDSSEGGSGAEMVFPAAYAPALMQLLASSPSAPVPVRSIRLPSKEQRCALADALWSEGVLCTMHTAPRAGR